MLVAMIHLYKHRDYQEYYDAQAATNSRKLDGVFIREHEADLVVNHFGANVFDAGFGICHGVRNGWEVRRFRELIGIEIIGTEIAPTATQFEHVIQWDFHRVKTEWIGRVDFLYSNSLDHSHHPRLALVQWLECLSTNGIAYIHWTPAQMSGAEPADCFGATHEELLEMLQSVGCVVDQLDCGEQRIIYAVASP